jgi:hypothetical protein
MLAGDSRASFFQNGKVHNCQHCEGELKVTHSTAKKLFLGTEKTEFRGQKVLAWGGSGVYDAMLAYTEGLLNGVDLEIVHKIAAKVGGRIGCDLIIVTDVSCWHVESTTAKLVIEEVTKFPFAIGSGKPAAYLACKFLGTTAFGAVGAATHSDLGTGGKINYVLCREETFDRKIHVDTWSEAELRQHIAGLNN